MGSGLFTKKTEGGLGIRASHKMNKALLAQMGWRLIHDQTSLWERLLRGKYKVDSPHEEAWMLAKKPGWSTWRSVSLGLREVVITCRRWVLGNGSEIIF